MHVARDVTWGVLHPGSMDTPSSAIEGFDLDEISEVLGKQLGSSTAAKLRESEGVMSAQVGANTCVYVPSGYLMLEGSFSSNCLGIRKTVLPVTQTAYDGVCRVAALQGGSSWPRSTHLLGHGSQICR